MASVNVPTNQAQKEKDINTKLQLYGIYSAFANGKVPSNKQIDVALNSLLASRAMSKPSNRLSSEGRLLVDDVRKVVQQTKMLLLSKNEGNLIQEFVWDAQNIDGANAATPHAPVDKATAQQHGDQALDGLKTLGRLILSNGQFRKLLSDATLLLRDVAGDAAQSAASKVNPDQERLKQIDQPAEDNTWHDVPDMNAQSLKQQARETYDRNKPFSVGEAKQAVQDGKNTAQNHPSQDNREAGKAGIKNAMQNLQAKAQENVPDEQQERARNMKDTAVQKTKNYVNEKIPQERREQTIYRLKKMVVEIQGHSDYQQAIDTLLDLAGTYAGHTKSVTKQTVGTVQEAHADTNLQRVERNLKTLIERFANFTSTDDLFEAINALYRDADRDPELKNWFKRLDRYVRKCLKEQGYILRDEATREWNELYDQGDYLLRERYKDHSNHLVDEIKFLTQQFDNDPQNNAFAEAVTKLFLDLGRDENGQPTFKTHLIKDLTEVIVPAIFENTRYVPIPRIEVSDPMVDLVVENLVIESDNLFPNSLEFSTDNYWRYGRKSISNHRDNKIMIAASGIQMDLRDVAYYVKKKQGFPSITDKGVMDIVLAGEGFSFKIAARNAQKSDRSHFVAIDNVDVVIKNLAIKIKQSNHKLLFTLAKSLVLKLMRPAIQKAIEKMIKDNFMKADAFAYSIHQEVQRGAQYAKQHPEEAGSIYQRYVQAFQAKINEKKSKAQDKTKNTDVKLAMTKEDSMFKNISLPGGISTKATEYKELARKGQRWESPVFSIGSGGPSGNLPRAQTIQRKPHSSRSPGVRGGNQPSGPTSSSGLGTSSAMGGVGGSSYQPGNTVSSSSTGYATGAMPGTATGYATGSDNYSSGNYGIGSTGPTSAVGGSGYSSTMPPSAISGTGYDGASYGSGIPSSTTGAGGYSSGMPSSTVGGGNYGTTTHTIGGPSSTSAVAPGSVGVASSGFNQEVEQAFRATGTSGLSSGTSGVSSGTGLGSSGVTGSSAANTSFYDSATVDRR